MKSIWFLIRMLAALVLVLANIFILGFFNRAYAETEKKTIVFFYLNVCDSCTEVDILLDDITAELKKVNQDLVIYRLNTSEPHNYELLSEYFDIYGVPQSNQIVPIAFIGDTYFSGEKSIREGLQAEISKDKGIRTIEPSDIEEKSGNDKNLLYDVNILGVFLTGLVNGLNPCSLSILLFLLSLFIVKSVNTMKLGIVFCAGKFIAYFLLGTIFFTLLSQIDFEGYKGIFKIVIVLLLIVLIFLNLKDSFSAKNEKYNKIRLQLPVPVRKASHNLIKRLSGITNIRFLMVAGFATGVVISIFEFLCTGQIYLMTIIYVLKNSNDLNIQALLYFLTYNVAFILPLLILTFLIHKGKEIFDVSEKIREKLPLIKKINAALLFIFGVVILLVY